MTWETIAAVATVAGVMFSVYMAIRKIRSDARALAERQSADQLETYNKGVADGQRSRDDEVRQMKSERDDARRERESNKADAKEWRDRYFELRDKGMH